MIAHMCKHPHDLISISLQELQSKNNCSSCRTGRSRIHGDADEQARVLNNLSTPLSARSRLAHRVRFPVFIGSSAEQDETNTVVINRYLSPMYLGNLGYSEVNEQAISPTPPHTHTHTKLLVDPGLGSINVGFPLTKHAHYHNDGTTIAPRGLSHGRTAQVPMALKIRQQ